MKKIWLILIGLCAQKIAAQHFAPIAGGQYSGVHATKINPAFTAYTVYNWHLNLIGAWANVNNNYLTLKLPYSAYRLINNSIPQVYKTENGNPRWDSSWLKERLNGRPKHVGVGFMLYAPSFTMRLKNDWHVGLVTDATALGRVSGMSESLAHALNKELDTAKNAFSQFSRQTGASNTLHRMTISGNAWATAGINVSKSIKLDWKNELLLGVTLKKAIGFGGAYFMHDNMTATNLSQNSFSLDHTNIRYASYAGPGQGMGLDLGTGWIYHKPEYRQPGGYKDKHTLYLFKFGASLLDIGNIRYKNATVTTIVNNRLSTWNTQNVEQKLKGMSLGYVMLDTILNNLPNYRSSKQDIRIGLPTRLALSADYQVSPHCFVNTQIVQSLRSRYSVHARHQSYLAVAPRWEWEFFEFSLPLYLEYDYRAFRVGASMRLGPLYIGSNNLASLLYTKSVRDADIFVGIAFGNIPDNWRNRWLKRHHRTVAPAGQNDCEKM